MVSLMLSSKTSLLENFIMYMSFIYIFLGSLYPFFLVKKLLVISVFSGLLHVLQGFFFLQLFK